MPGSCGEWNADTVLHEGQAPLPAPGAGDDAPADAAADAAGRDGAVRRRILRRFEAWLDEVLADEPPPEGLDAELLAELQADAALGAEPAEGQARDAFRVLAALVGLTEETRLQGRAFKQLQELLSPLGPLPESIQQVLSANDEALAAVRGAAEAAQRDAEARLLDVLLDVRDRLVRGARSARRQFDAPPPEAPGTWLGRLLGRRPKARCGDPEAAEALLKGYVLSLDRLNEALGRLGVSEIECVGRTFDPGRMIAVDVEQTADAPDGTVVEVYRTGYERHGQVCRPAEVKVARRPAGPGPAAAGQEAPNHERE